MVAYTEADKLQVAELAFTGSVNDQQAYLKTIRDLNRFFGKNKRLSNLTSLSAHDYDQLPLGVKIVAVDILRDAFLSEPAHSFTLAESNDSDPRAILIEIGQFYNRTNASLGELEYRAAMAVVNDGTMLVHEAPTSWIIRMREAHTKLNKLEKDARDADSSTDPWNNSTEVYKSLLRRRPTEQDTLELMTRGRPVDEVRGHGASATDPIWFPWPSWFTYEVKTALLKIVKASSTTVEVAAQPTMNNFLRTFLTWYKDNSHLCPAAASDSVRRTTEPGKSPPKSGTDKKRTDGGIARCIHELDHQCQHNHKTGPHAGQCKFIIKSDGTAGQGCNSAARWKKTNGDGGGGNGGGGNGGEYGKRKADKANGRGGDTKRTKKVQVDGKTVVYTHCPTWSKNAECHPKCPLAALHGRDHKGVKTSSGYTGTGARKPASIGIEQVPNKIKKAITKDFANRLGQKLKTASDASVRRTVKADDETASVSDFLNAGMASDNVDFATVLSETMAECAYYKE